MQFAGSACPDVRGIAAGMTYTLTGRQMVLQQQPVRYRLNPDLIEDSMGLKFLVISVDPAVAVFVQRALELLAVCFRNHPDHIEEVLARDSCPLRL